MNDEQKQAQKDLHNYDNRYKENLMESHLAQIQQAWDQDKQQLPNVSDKYSQLQIHFEVELAQRLARVQTKNEDDIAAWSKAKDDQYDQLKEQMQAETKHKAATHKVVTTQSIPPLVGETLRSDDVDNLRDNSFLQFGKSSATDIYCNQTRDTH
eukprot:gene11779-24693_t